MLQTAVHLLELTQLAQVAHLIESQREPGGEADSRNAQDCKCFGGNKHCSFGIVWLLLLLVPSTTLYVWTTLLMPSRGVLAI